MLILENAKIEHLGFNKFLVTLEHEMGGICEIGYDDPVDPNLLSFWIAGKDGEKYEHLADIDLVKGEGKKFLAYKVESANMKKNPVGRPALDRKRVTLSMKIKPELKHWLESHEISKGGMVERLVEAEIRRKEELESKDWVREVIKGAQGKLNL
tara:strand:- start:1458 stop:1919 length:462 start_codon:yes stop_codon:yes gene_type:complete